MAFYAGWLAKASSCFFSGSNQALAVLTPQKKVCILNYLAIHYVDLHKAITQRMTLNWLVLLRISAPLTETASRLENATILRTGGKPLAGTVFSGFREILKMVQPS